MKKLIVLAVIGFAAQLIDGSLGMAYGLTSTSLLLFYGIAPAVASASVHMAEVVTTAASGVSHLRFGNVDRYVVKTLMLPGSVGAFAGACFLSSLPGDAVKPYVAVFLFLLGVFVLIRFTRVRLTTGSRPRMYSRRFLCPLGLFAGFLDSTGGGGWGPLTTPVLLSRKGMEPRKVIGSVDTSEFFIAVSATVGFWISLGWEDFDWMWVGALMLGGLIAAPIAAWLVKVLPSRILGVLVGWLIILTNTRTLVHSWGILPPSWHIPVYIILLACCLLHLVVAIKRHIQDNRASWVVNANGAVKGEAG